MSSREMMGLWVREKEQVNVQSQGEREQDMMSWIWDMMCGLTCPCRGEGNTTLLPTGLMSLV